MKNIITLFCIILFNAYYTAQTHYYVSPNGSDTNNGTWDAPWKTIQHSLNEMSENSILNVAAGVYHEKIVVPKNNIRIKNQTAEKPVIDADGIHNQTAIIAISDKHNIIIEGLELKNNQQNFAQGILINGASKKVEIKNCSIHDIHFSKYPNAKVSPNTNANAIIAYGDNATTPISNLTIEHNEIYNCRLGYSEGITLNGNVDGFKIMNNKVHDLTNIGIDIAGHYGACSNPKNDQARNGVISYNTIYNCLSPYATSGGIYIDGGKHVKVEYNTSFQNGYGIEIGCESIGKSTSDIMVRNNVFYNNKVCALALGGYDYPNGSGKVINAIFRNNTCLSNDYSNSGMGELYLSYSEQSVIENNIFYTNNQNHLAYAEWSQPNLIFDYNLFYTPNGANVLDASWNGVYYSSYANFISGTSTNQHSTFGNPKLMSDDITAPDFHLLSGSLAINVGNPNFLGEVNETDFFGELRVENGRVDCGADEYGKTLSLGQNAKPKIRIYPNPVTEQLHIDTHSNHALTSIFSANGDLVKRAEGSLIDVKSLPKGLYLLRIVIDGQIYYQKVMKK